MRSCGHLAVCGLVLMATSASATVYVIHADGSGDYPTIQAAVDAVPPWGSVIELAPGVFTGEGNRDIQLHGKPLTIRGVLDDPAACIIDCEGNEADPHRAFIFDATDLAGAFIRSLTIQNGYATGSEDLDPDSRGGGILVGQNAAPAFIDLVIRDCTALDGAGVLVWSGASPTFTRCTFTHNTAWWGGGGGVWVFQGSGTFTDCRFIENLAHQVGAGLAADLPASLVVTGCLFQDNALEWGAGGGASVYSGTATFAHTTFVGNHGLGPDVWGAALETSWSGVTVNSCTFVGNAADPGRAAAISSGYGSILHVENSIIANSESGTAVECYGGSYELTCCDIWGNPDGDWTDCIAGMEGTEGNISLDPLFCDEAGGDLTLRADSPCAPQANPDCDLIGAWPVGCGFTAVETMAPAKGLALAVFPNPMSGSCQISLRQPQAGAVTVEVLDLRGRVVRRLHDGPAAAAKDGGLTLLWDGGDASGARAACGVYWLRASGVAGRALQRVVVLR